MLDLPRYQSLLVAALGSCEILLCSCQRFIPYKRYLTLWISNIKRKWMQTLTVMGRKTVARPLDISADKDPPAGSPTCLAGHATHGGITNCIKTEYYGLNKITIPTVSRYSWMRASLRFRVVVTLCNCNSFIHVSYQWFFMMPGNQYRFQSKNKSRIAHTKQKIVHRINDCHSGCVKIWQSCKLKPMYSIFLEICCAIIYR